MANTMSPDAVCAAIFDCRVPNPDPDVGGDVFAITQAAKRLAMPWLDGYNSIHHNEANARLFIGRMLELYNVESAKQVAQDMTTEKLAEWIVRKFQMRRRQVLVGPVFDKRGHLYVPTSLHGPAPEFFRIEDAPDKSREPEQVDPSAGL